MGLVLLLLVVLALVSGCAKQQSEAAAAVTGYLSGLPYAIRGESLDPINEYATQEQVDRVRRYAAMTLQEGTRMEASLLSFSVTDEREEPGLRVVETAEKWRMLQTDLESGEVLSEQSYDLLMRYDVLDTPDGWRVAASTELERR